MTYVTLPKMRLLNIRTSSTSFRRGGVSSEIVENLKKKKRKKEELQFLPFIILGVLEKSRLRHVCPLDKVWSRVARKMQLQSTVNTLVKSTINAVVKRSQAFLEVSKTILNLNTSVPAILLREAKFDLGVINIMIIKILPEF